MIYVCLWSPRWATDAARLAELATSLLEVAPRVSLDGRGVIWADARGLPAREIARALVERAGGAEQEVRAGVSTVPVAAELAARGAGVPLPVIPAKAGTQVPAEGSNMDPRFRATDHPRVIPAKAGTQVPAEGSNMDPRFRGDDGRVCGDDVGVCGDDVGCGDDIGTAVTIVPPGRERAFIAPLPLELLGPDPRLRELLDGLGVRSCGELAALSRESVEVRLGAAAGAIWRLARADDRRILFRPIPRERPQASMDFVEYEVRDAARLVFTANALLGSVCSTLESRGERARSLSLSLHLSGGETQQERLRSSRPTADRDFWIRRLQDLLDRMRLPEPVVGICLEVDETEPRSSTQGDLFDRGFATASAVEEAVARLLDEQGPVFAALETDGHPLAERRTRWVARTAESAGRAATGSGGRSGARRRKGRRGPAATGPVPRPAPALDPSARPGLALVREGTGTSAPAGDQRSGGAAAGASPVTAGPSPASPPSPATRTAADTPGLRLLEDRGSAPALTLQLLREPRAIGVRIAFRGVQVLPESYLYAGEWREIAIALGPDRVSGGRWEEQPFARDYFRCISGDGRLIWIFRDLDENRWYLHGWWE